MVRFGKRVLQILVLSGALSLLMPPLLASAGGSWTEGEFTWGERMLRPGINSTEDCTPSRVTVVGSAPSYQINPDVGEVCVYERPSFRYGIYTKITRTWYGTEHREKFFVIATGISQKMYVVDGFDLSYTPIEIPSSDDLHFNYGYAGRRHLVYIKDFIHQLERANSFDQPLRYRVKAGVEQSYIPHEGDAPPRNGGVGVSDNGRWMAVEMPGAGMMKIDMTTRKLYGFSDRIFGYGVGSDVSIIFRVSNDGTKIAGFDENFTPTIYTLQAGCTEVADSYTDEFAQTLRTIACPTDGGRLDAKIPLHYDNWVQAKSAVAAGFSRDGDALYFDDYVYEKDEDGSPIGSPTVYRTPLYAGGYVAEQDIEYLALGDSFTSGEGDIEKKADGSSYYLPGTENKNQCHLSSRSYPFLLQTEHSIDPSRMKSVACSGAQILPDYMAPPENYLGQGNRLQSLSAAELNTTRQSALADFTPGHIPQLEFVKERQPKAITLMGGGNDVGFGSILAYCASPGWRMAFADDTCGYAIEGHPLRKTLAQSIVSQYDYTLLLLRKIRQASPATTVYVIGYPSFISDKPGVNCFNSGALDSSEREMISEGVTFMNDMLEKAALSMGMQYVDIQDTLEGGRLCEGSEYVTGAFEVGLEEIVNKETQELFHPNARGHEKFAQRIAAEGFQAEANRNTSELATAAELEVPAYFGEVAERQTRRHEITSSSVSEQSEMVVYMPDGSLAPGSDVTLTMFSDAIDLGSVSANASGGLNVKITLPATLKPGRHVLVLDGVSPFDELLRYFQFVTVVSLAENDADGDDIKDADDPCLFITTWIDEKTGQDVCIVTPPDESDLPDGGLQDEETEAPKGESQESIPLASGRSSDKSATSSATVKATPDRRGDDSVAEISSSETAERGSSSYAEANQSNRQNYSPEQAQGIVMPNEEREVLGAHIGNAQGSPVRQAPVSYLWLVAAGVIGLSTLLLGYAIVRALRRRV